MAKKNKIRREKQVPHEPITGPDLDNLSGKARPRKGNPKVRGVSDEQFIATLQVAARSNRQMYYLRRDDYLRLIELAGRPDPTSSPNVDPDETGQQQKAAKKKSAKKKSAKKKPQESA